jgi:hypothetical protein
VFGATDWANLTHAGAFVVGAALGVVATIRVMRHVLGYVRRDDQHHNP